MPLLLQLAITGNGTKQTCGKRSIDALEELKEDERDRVARWQQAISARVRQFLNQTLRPELRQVVALRSQTVIGGGKAERVSDLRIQFRRGECGTGSDMCKPDECVEGRPAEVFAL